MLAILGWFPSGGRTFLSRDRFELHTLRDGKLDPAPQSIGWGKEKPETPCQVQVSIQTKSHGSHVGGYRVYLRDVLGGEVAPFQHIRHFEAVSPQIFRYRPYTIHSSRALRIKFDAPKAGPEPEPGTKELEPGTKFAEAQKIFASLEQKELRTQPGTPRLTRATNPARGNASGEAQAPVPLRIRPEQLTPLPGELGLSNLPTLEDLTKALASWDPKKLSPELLVLLPSLNGHCRLLGPLVDWMYANGFARDLILPLGINTAADIKKMLEGCPSLKDLPAWVALAVRPVSGCPSHACELIGTVRLCILPGQDDVKWKGLEATYQTLLPWALPAFKDKVVVFDENLAGSDLLPWDKSHRCHFLWAGIHDGWRHTLQVVVEALDRYAMARAFFDTKLVPRLDGEETPLKLEQRPLLADPTPAQGDFDTSQIRELTIPRLHPAPAPPAIIPVLDSTRVAFRIQESPERLHATHNLLNRVRQGPLTTLVQFAYTFPAKDVFKSLNLDEEWNPPTDEPLQVDGELPTGAPGNGSAEPAWTETQEDEVEIRDALFFLDYLQRVRFRADHQEDSKVFSEARTSRLPLRFEGR